MGSSWAKTDKESGEAAEALLRQYPKLHGIFTKSGPVVVAAIKKAGRKDVWVASWGLSEANAKMLLEGGPFWCATTGPAAVRAPAVVNAVAKWHLGRDLPYMIAGPSLISATPDNVEQAWRQLNAGTADETPPWVKAKEWVSFLQSVGKA